MDTTELKQKVEALLFSSGKKMTLNEISVLTRAKPEAVNEALQQLVHDYTTKESSLMIIQEGEFSKITVKEKHLELVRKIVAQTELSKTVMETLATIAWKAPCLQSEIIKIRTNKAYDHIKELEEEGFIGRTKKGRTQSIKLTQRFYDYFDIPHEKVKEVFSRFENLEKQIQQKEDEVEQAREKIKTIEDEHRKQKEAMETFDLKNIDLPEELTEQERLAKELIEAEAKEERHETGKHPVEVVSEKLGNLDVVDIEEEQGPQQKKNKIDDQKSGEDINIQEAEERLKRDLPKHIKEKVNKRVKEIVPAASKIIEEEEAQEKQQQETEAKQVEEEKEEELEPEEEETDEQPETQDGLKDEEPEKKAEKEIEQKIDKRVQELLKPEEKKTE